jgi:hypothetical protein
MLPSVELDPGGVVTAADLDGDGLSDLISIPLLSNTVSVLLNRSAQGTE